MDECLKDGMEPKAPDKTSLLYNIENCKARVRYEPATIEALKVYTMPPKRPKRSRTTIPGKKPKMDTSRWGVNPKHLLLASTSRSPKWDPPIERTAVSDLDEPGLRALLDEAISYKTPKDAHGKSELFKELLQSVDNDNKNSMRVHSERSRKPRRQSTKKDTEKSYCHSHGSLQDLNNVLSNSAMGGDVDQKVKDPASWKIGMSKSSSSPPQFLQIEDLIAAQRYDEAGLPRQSRVENGSCDDIYQLRSSSSKLGSQKYPTASAPFELPEIRRTLSSGCLEEEPYMELTTSYKSMNCMSMSSDKDELPTTSLREKFGGKVKSYDENANSLSAAQERKGRCRRLKAKNDKNTILSEHIQGHRSDIVEDIDALMKYIESPTRTDKSSGPLPSRTERADSRQRMNLQKSSRISNKIRPVRDKSSDTVRKGRKSKDDKFQKSNSLEEVCISTFEDLTSNVEQGEDPATSVVNNSSVRKNSRFRGSDVCASQFGSSSSIIKTAAVCNDSIPISPIRKKDNLDDTDSDFLTVKKKQRKKKNAVFHSQRAKGQLSSAYSAKKNFPCQSKERNCYSFERHSISRRKSTSSVPSSEKSDDTSDGDSVHSLPISSETCSMRTLGESCIKTVSYAAIARAAPSPLKPFSEDPDSTEKALSSPEESFPESIPTVMVQLPLRKDKSQSIRITNEDYPPLQHDSSNDMYVEYTVSVPKKEKVVYENVVNVEKTVIVKVPLPKKNVAKPPLEKNCSSGVKRPAVIILDTDCSPCEIEDLEFGFEVNQKLLEEEDSSGSSEGTPEGVTLNDEFPEESPQKEVFRPVAVEITSDDPVISYLMEEWNKVVDELAAQDNDDPDVMVKVMCCDC